MLKEDKIGLAISIPFVLIVIIIGLLIVSSQNKKNETRIITAKVISVENDDTLLEDTTGNVWSIKDDGYLKGDRVIITFDTKGTNSVLDDEIIKISVDK